MSETAVDDTAHGFLLDGDLPRLGNAQPMLPDLPSAAASAAAEAPALPVVSQVLTGEPAPISPTLPSAGPAPALPAPVLPSPTPAATPSIAEMAAVVAAEEQDKVEVRRHPMAHLMPEKLKPSEASLRAAEQRAAKKAKARKIKIIALVVSLAVCAIAGPPLGRWLVDAINEAGSTESDEPAPAVESDDEPATGPASGLQAIEDAKQLTGDSTPPVSAP